MQDLVIDVERVNGEIYMKVIDLLQFIRVSKAMSDPTWAEAFDDMEQAILRIHEVAVRDL